MLIHQSRLAVMGEMINNIAHQWRQPLNSLGLVIQQTQLLHDCGELTKDVIDSNVNSSMTLILHMSQTIDDFKNFFRPETAKSSFKVTSVIASTMSVVEGSFKYNNVKIEVRKESDPVIFGHKNEFAQSILNILNNAKDVLTERKTKNPTVCITIGHEKGRAVVIIADNAGGIPEEILPRIFDAYFTTKESHAGTGLGLYMTRTIIEKKMGGSIGVRNTDKGAEFRIEV
jgi:C4-dicarboxylate-specific signal transduction histidine kinase